MSRVHPSAGNLAPQSEIFPGYETPVIRLDNDSERELVMMTWGFVLPQQGRPPKCVTNTHDELPQEIVHRAALHHPGDQLCRVISPPRS